MADLTAIKRNLMETYKGCVVTQSYLRLERDLQGGATTQLKFDVLSTESVYGAPSPIENRLKVTDVFVATAISMYIYKAGTSATASAVTLAQRAGSRLATSPNVGVFTTAGESAALMNIYNGNSKLLVNRKVYFESLDCRRFYRVGDIQAGLIQATGGVTTQEDNWPEANYGMIGLDPTLTIGGASQNDFSVNMPAAVTAAGTASSNFIVLYFRGYQVQGAADQFERAQRAVDFQG